MEIKIYSAASGSSNPKLSAMTSERSRSSDRGLIKMATRGKNTKSKWKPKVLNSHFRTKHIVSVNGRVKAKVMRRTKIHWNAVEDEARQPSVSTSTTSATSTGSTFSDVNHVNMHESGTPYPLNSVEDVEMASKSDCAETVLSGW